MSRDLYEVLGVSKEATKEEIAAAYRKKVKANHPDLNLGDPGAEGRIKEINAAYGVLSDDGKRLAYDRANAPAQSVPSSEAAGFGSAFDYVTFVANGFRRSGFGGGPFESPVRGRDVEMEVTIAFEESVLGAFRKISSATGGLAQCLRCCGARSEPGTRKIPCPHCSGTGKSFYPGFGGQSQTCKQCGGHGDTPMRSCSACSGTGKIRETREMTLKIPSGVEDGTRLRLAGKGEAGIGGSPGDLFVTVRVRESDGPFKRRGRDLFCESRVDFAAAACAIAGMEAKIKVRHIDGKDVEIRLPPEIRSGETILTVPGAGVKTAAGSGGLHVLLHVEMPVIRTPRAAFLMRELLEELGVGGPRSVPSPDDA